MEDAAHAVARLASPNAVLPAAWLTTALLWRRDGAAIGLGTSLAVAAEALLKPAIGRRRPRLWGRNEWRSFPSGHSAASTAYLVGLALVAAPPRHRAPALVAAGIGAASVNALRLYTRAHWPGDVVAGDLIGLGAIIAARRALASLRRRRAAPTV